MGVVLRVGKQKAFLRNGEWRCANPRLEHDLNETTRVWIEETGGPALRSTDPELDVAQAVAGKVNGRILQHSPADPKVSYHIYLSRRQTTFSFV